MIASIILQLLSPLILLSFGSSAVENCAEVLMTIEVDGYIEKVDGEKVPCVVKGFHETKVIVVIDGKKTKFKAEELNGFKIGNEVFDTGLISNNGGLRCVFLHRFKGGKMKSYYRPEQPSAEGMISTPYFYYVRVKHGPDSPFYLVAKKTTKPSKMRNGVENMRTAGSDCPAFLNMLATDWAEEKSLHQMQEFYNANCAE